MAHDAAEERDDRWPPVPEAELDALLLLSEERIGLLLALVARRLRREHPADAPHLTELRAFVMAATLTAFLARLMHDRHGLARGDIEAIAGVASRNGGVTAGRYLRWIKATLGDGQPRH